MANRLIPVLPMTQLTLVFSATGNPTIVLGARFVDVRDAASGVLVVRLNNRGNFPNLTGGQITIGLQNVYVGPDDPLNTYAVAAQGSSPFASVNLKPTDAAPPLLYESAFSASGTNVAGPMCQCQLTSTYGSVAGSAVVTLAVDLLVRDSS